MTKFQLDLTSQSTTLRNLTTARGFGVAYEPSGAMHQRMTTMERAFDLARSGKFTTLCSCPALMDGLGLRWVA